MSNPTTGLTLDRVPARGKSDATGIASIAATGFALAGFCIGSEHHWVSQMDAENKVEKTLEFLVNKAPREHGWFYHFMDAQTGKRTPKSEISSIDTAILVAGALTARGCFHDNPQIVSLSTELYNEIDFPWMMNGSDLYFSLGWTPEHQFLAAKWESFSELLILYVLGIGSPTHPIFSASWEQWKMPLKSEAGYTFLGGGPLFVQQYSLAWLDLRGRSVTPVQTRPGTFRISVFPPSFHVNYFLSAELATKSQQNGFQMLSARFRGYSENVWGLTASDSPVGYIDWGDSLEDPRIDGTVAPSAAAGSLMFSPEICIPALRAMVRLYGEKIYGRYGFVDAFNPTTGWIDPDVVGIAAGITLLSAENLRTGSVWRWFMSNPEPERALDISGVLDVRHPWERYRIDPKADGCRP